MTNQHISYAPNKGWLSGSKITAQAHQLPPKDRLTFEQLSTLAHEVRSLFADRNIRIQPLSALGRLLTHVDSISAQWKSGVGQTVRAMIDGTTAMRVIDSILAAKNESDGNTCYQRIAKKDVDLFSPEPSQGKDALWELQLLRMLKNRGMHAILAEPDILTTIGDITVPIACKKIYSENNIEGQLRSAGKQLAKTSLGGIAALNLDAQVPRDHLIVCDSASEASNILTKVAFDFLSTHQQTIRKFISAEKFDAVLFSISCPMENRNVRPRFNVGTESFLWCPPDVCSADGIARMDTFRDAMNLQVFTPQ
jgi:hypothetical protein